MTHKWSPLCSLEGIPDDLLLAEAAKVRRRRRNPLGRAPGRPVRPVMCSKCGDEYPAGKFMAHFRKCGRGSK